jgi:hypothetical protein
MDSALEHLLAGAPGYRPTAPERRLLEFALERFGAPQSSFFLSGLGVQSWEAKRTYSLSFAEGGEPDVVISAEALRYGDGRPVLPQGREPLVYLALLRLLADGPGPTFDSPPLIGHGRVFDLLGWDDTAMSRAAARQALSRYHFTNYAWRGLLRGRRVEVRGHALPSYYQDRDKGGRRGAMFIMLPAGRVTLEDLTRRRLCAIDWDAVGEITRRDAPGGGLIH